MSIHSDLMRSASEVLALVQGDAAAAQYKPPGKAVFIWTGASAGSEHGRWMPTDNGDLLKVESLLLQGPTAVLVASGVTGIENEAVVTVSGKEWSIDPAESYFGPSFVRLGLFRRPIATHFNAQDNQHR